MSNTAKDRPLGRELALAALFHVEAAADSSMVDALETFWEQAPRDEAGLAATTAPTGRGAAADVKEVRDFAAKLAGHWVEHAERIDARIQTASSRWRLARMDSVDRNAMRIALCELECFPNTPLKVVLSEAVRIAARFGSERSASFVNGVLATVINRGDAEAGEGGGVAIATESSADAAIDRVGGLIADGSTEATGDAAQGAGLGPFADPMEPPATDDNAPAAPKSGGEKGQGVR